MKYIVLVKVAAESKCSKHLPSMYPLDWHEFDTREDAEQTHLGRPIMSSDQFKIFKKEMDDICCKKPWWKIWGK